jgi:acetyltransferase-like isoleucine patch superfamily enzyme
VIGSRDCDAPRIHPTALVEPGVSMGARTAVWDGVHVRGPSSIGHDCIIGEKTYVAYGVQIGNFVKINAMVYIPTGITIEDRVMIAAGVIFTNDRYPRAFDELRGGLADSGPGEDTLPGRVMTGATIGAGAVVGPGLTIGTYAMVGMGAVVTADVPPHALVIGNPARIAGWVCICGRPVPPGASQDVLRCGRCAGEDRAVSLHG